MISIRNIVEIDFRGYTDKRGSISDLIAAANARRLALVEKIIEAGGDINEQEEITGNTALHIAVFRHSEALASILLQYPQLDLDVRRFLDLEETPQELAILNGCYGIARMINDERNRRNGFDPFADPAPEDFS
ncbi:MAG: ankyrin repeat domain-containing protein [Pseudomonadota bacterium]